MSFVTPRCAAMSSADNQGSDIAARNPRSTNPIFLGMADPSGGCARFVGGWTDVVTMYPDSERSSLPKHDGVMAVSMHHGGAAARKMGTTKNYSLGAAPWSVA